MYIFLISYYRFTPNRTATGNLVGKNYRRIMLLQPQPHFVIPFFFSSSKNNRILESYMYKRLRDECGFLCFFSLEKRFWLLSMLFYFGPPPPYTWSSSIISNIFMLLIYSLVKSGDRFAGISFKVCTLLWQSPVLADCTNFRNLLFV